MHKAQKTRIYPNNRTETLLRQGCGVSRLAYNVCLAKWNEDYANGIKPNGFSIKKWFNEIKRTQYPFVYEVSKWIPEAAIKDLDTGFKNMYKKNSKHPRFHKRGFNDTFRIDGSVVKVEDKKLYLPKGMIINMAEGRRWKKRKINNITISLRAGMWFVSIAYVLPDVVYKNQGTAVGIDLGIKTLATLSDGSVLENPKYLYKEHKKLVKLQRSVSRKQKRSSNRRKAIVKLGRQHYRIACLRNDIIHKFTTNITRKYDVVCIEDLNVAGMLKNHNLARSISDASFAEIRRQIEYKAHEVRYVDRFYPSSKTCSQCGSIQDMPLEQRQYVCPNCGLDIDRDLNAALNILRQAMPEVTTVDSSTLVSGRSSNLTVNAVNNLTAQVCVS